MKCEINGQQAEKLFLPNWEYNVVRIQNELKRIIERKGGEVVSTTNYWPKTLTYVVNRSLMERIEFVQNHIDWMNMVCPRHNPKYRESKIYLDDIHEVEYLKSVPNDPILKTGATAFVLNGIYYGLIFNDNMFFDTHYLVTKVCGEDDNRFFCHSGYEVLPDNGWKYDCLIRNDCSQDDIHRVAMCILNILHTKTPYVRGKYTSHIYSNVR